MWQELLNRHASESRFDFLSVAVDVDPERARPFAQPYSFPTVVDSVGALGRLLDFDVVPNGVFLDEQGVIRFLHIGGFDIRRPEIAQQVEALLDARFDAGERPSFVTQEPLELEIIRTELAAHPEDASLHLALADALVREGRVAEAEPAFRRADELNPTDWSAPFGLGTVLHRQGRTAEALDWWRIALARDPANFTVRKQIWMVEHPERFYPTIDFDWQKEQRQREGIA